MKNFLPSSCRGFIEQWQSVKPFPALRDIGKSALFDLINSLDDESIEALENFFNDVVIVEVKVLYLMVLPYWPPSFIGMMA